MNKIVFIKITKLPVTNRLKLSNGKQIWETEKNERERERKVSQEEMRSIGQILMVIVSIKIDRLYIHTFNVYL